MNPFTILTYFFTNEMFSNLFVIRSLIKNVYNISFLNSTSYLSMSFLFLNYKSRNVQYVQNYKIIHKTKSKTDFFSPKNPLSCQSKLSPFTLFMNNKNCFVFFPKCGNHACAHIGKMGKSSLYVVDQQ